MAPTHLAICQEHKRGHFIIMSFVGRTLSATGISCVLVSRQFLARLSCSCAGMKMKLVVVKMSRSFICAHDSDIWALVAASLNYRGNHL